MEKPLKKRKALDIEGVFREKNPKLARLLPGFIFRYLRRIIHEDYLNSIMERHGHKFGVEFADAVIKEFNVTIKTRGDHNIPGNGRYIFVANHPLGGFDGIIFMHLMAQKGFQFKFIVNDILNNIKNLEPLFLPVNKHGGHSKEIVKTIDDTFGSDLQILSFPSGYVSRRIKGKITELPWQKSFIVKAVKYERDVVPVFFSGHNSSFFYNLHSIRKFLGIKANLEMFYLPDETYKHRNKEITVTFGKPISYLTFDNKFKPLEWAAKVKGHIYKISENADSEFDFN